MKNLISRDDLLSELYGMIPDMIETPPDRRDWQIEINAVQNIIDAVIRRVMDMPSVTIIECSECRYSQLSQRDDVKYCDLWFPSKPHHLPKNHFCGMGERKHGRFNKGNFKG